MTNAPDSFNLDVRIRERLLKKRVITAATVDSHLAGLKDAEAVSVVLDLEQPALAKPPAPVAPVVQPVQPVRSAIADLPPPPPGLIKESPTPPYTPMVIENVPRDSAVNGVGLAASASEDEQDDEDDDLDDLDADETDADDAGAAQAAAEPAAAELAVAEPAAAEPAAANPTGNEAGAPGEAAPKGDGIDDEWGG